MKTLLLPGMDGTGTLFASLQRALPPELGASAITYPPDRCLGYDELLETIEVPDEQLRAVRPDLRTSTLDAPHLVLQRRPIEAAAAISELFRPTT